MSFVLDNGIWKEECVLIDKEGNESVSYRDVSIVDIPVTDLLVEYEDMVLELADKNVELGKVKEEHMVKEFEILTSFDFKKVYGKDNEKIRKAHVHNELFDLDKCKESLELSVEYLKSYIGLLKETIRIKHDSTPHINSPTPIVLDGGHINKDKLEKQIRKALDDVKP